MKDQQGLTVVSQKKWVKYYEQFLRSEPYGKRCSVSGIVNVSFISSNNSYSSHLIYAQTEPIFILKGVELKNSPTGVEVNTIAFMYLYLVSKVSGIYAR